MSKKSLGQIVQYCSVCKDYLEMKVVGEGEESEVTWLQCPRCQGILPHMELDEEEEKTDEDFSPDSISDEDAIEYDARNVFELGTVVYHRSWNDYGKVLEKVDLPGGRHAIRVHFVEQGEVQLLEQVPDA
ncbi:MAG: hypothetical protein QF492_03510 [Candidatus Krumholzibacteria bacterium]|nr:hypothetical protein [Candidatus Krumholzibacteria bacterium]MDP6668965.1 hypothetical protein [Candidatus Krumholzibacteria bacterium]MDP6797104.1 hypothetical protein [Candidatus Krumholzibacteria bacterium]MDP7022443.1 hypothetical protein [Candidatus Krumholzibacteria bacterium]